MSDKKKLIKKAVAPAKKPVKKPVKKTKGGLSNLDENDKRAIINNVITTMKKNKCIINFCGANNYANLKNILYNNAFNISRPAPSAPPPSVTGMHYNDLKQMYPIAHHIRNPSTHLIGHSDKPYRGGTYDRKMQMQTHFKKLPIELQTRIRNTALSEKIMELDNVKQLQQAKQDLIDYEKNVKKHLNKYVSLSDLDKYKFTVLDRLITDNIKRCIRYLEYNDKKIIKDINENAQLIKKQLVELYSKYLHNIDLHQILILKATLYNRFIKNRKINDASKIYISVGDTKQTSFSNEPYNNKGNYTQKFDGGKKTTKSTKSKKSLKIMR